jgi:hypothetical protein
MKPIDIAALVEAGIALLSGATATLYGFRILGKKPGVDARWDSWYERLGKHLRFLGPFIILFGIFKALSPVASPTVAAPPSAAPLENSRFGRFDVGTTWVYQSPAGDLTIKVVAHELRNGILCAKRESTQNARVLFTDYVRTDQQVFQKFGANNGAYVPPVPLAHESIQAPYQWHYVSATGKVTFDGEQSPGGVIETPLRKFDQTTFVRLRTRVPSGEQLTECWYAEGVGLIREVDKFPDGELLLELKAFHPRP